MNRTALLGLALLAGCSMSNKTARPAIDTGDMAAPPSVEVGGAGLDVRLTRDERGYSLRMNAPADSVWAVLPRVYDQLELSADLIDTRGRRYGSQATGLRVAGIPISNVARCGAQADGLQTATRMRVTLRIITTVTRIDDRQSLLTTLVTGQGSRIDGTSTGGSECVSTGELEERIAGRVRLEAGG